MSWSVIHGDCRDVMAGMDAGSVNCCVTSPPYFGLRDYGVAGQLGLEPTPEEYVAKMVAVFREVRRVLRDDGTLWLNLGDSYAGSWGAQSRPGYTDATSGIDGASMLSARQIKAAPKTTLTGSLKNTPGCKSKDLIGIPWMVAFALRADGWYLRSDIIWHKPNPMPESVTDRPTKSHEYLFLLAKSERYYYDAAAVAEPIAASSVARLSQAGLDEQVGSGRVPGKTNGNMKAVGPRFGGSKYGDDTRQEPRTKSGNVWTGSEKRNRRTVWSITTKPFKGAHFAVMPEALVEPCVLAGCPTGGVVLDPFTGSGTVGVVAVKNGRAFVGAELNPEYAAMARGRIGAAVPEPTLGLEAA